MLPSSGSGRVIPAEPPVPAPGGPWTVRFVPSACHVHPPLPAALIDGPGTFLIICKKQGILKRAKEICRIIIFLFHKISEACPNFPKGHARPSGRGAPAGPDGRAHTAAAFSLHGNHWPGVPGPREAGCLLGLHTWECRCSRETLCPRLGEGPALRGLAAFPSDGGLRGHLVCRGGGERHSRERVLSGDRELLELDLESTGVGDARDERGQGGARRDRGRPGQAVRPAVSCPGNSQHVSCNTSACR